MQKKFYTQERLFKIYALYDDVVEKRVYIGKTVSKLSNVYSQHRCGHNKYTEVLFEIDFLEPEMVLLEEVSCTGAVAYRHVLAWIKRFSDDEFKVMNPDGMRAQSAQMQEDTQKIYEQIAGVDLEEHLARLWQESKILPKKVLEKREKEQASTQLCLRLSPKDKTDFQRYCRSTNLRQTDAFAQLLNTAGGNSVPDIRRLSDLLEESEARCKRLVEEDETLRSGLAVSRAARIENNTREYFVFAQKAICEFVKVTYTKERYTGLPIKEYWYDNFKRRFPNAALYQYPVQEGSYIVRLQTLVWGKTRNPVYFLICTTQAGECLKFRFYQKREFIGKQVRHSVYAQVDSLGLFAGKTAPDGAVDLMAAFPLLNPMDQDQKEKLSLNELILGAEAKRKR